MKSFAVQPQPAFASRRRRACAAGLALALALGVIAAPAWAALPVGAPAPDFSADAALGGKGFRFQLADALKKGPVVVYFYPKAFTSGCTIEAHAFAEATPSFEALGATVVGLSNDDLDTLKKFSVEACRNKFAVAADPDAKVIKKYDAGMALLPGMASRISYAISPEGRVLQVHSAMDPDGHVKAMLAAVQAWHARQPAPARR